MSARLQVTAGLLTVYFGKVFLCMALRVTIVASSGVVFSLQFGQFPQKNTQK